MTKFDEFYEKCNLIDRLEYVLIRLMIDYYSGGGGASAPCM